MASRKYRLEQGESLPSEVARVARGRIDHALHELSGRSDKSPEDAVHTARKDIKKLRALMRLVRGELGDEVYRRESAAFRDAGRELADLRDADVMLATLDSLELPDDGPLRQALEAHRIRTAAGAREPAEAAAAVILADAAERVPEWPLQSEGFDAFEDALRRVYRQGRRRMRSAREDPSAERLHDWRKRAKDLWYFCTLLERAWPPVMIALGDEAHALSERLGDDHDLAVLLAFAEEHAVGTEPLRTAVAKRRMRLQDEAFAYGERLFAERPKAFVARVEKWWTASARAAGAEPAHQELG